MVSDVSLEMQSDSKNYVGLQDDEITEPVHTIKSACASTGGPDERKKRFSSMYSKPEKFKSSKWLYNSLRKQPSFFAPGPRKATQAGSEEGRLFSQASFITTLERLSCHKHFTITQAQTKVSFFYLNLYYKLNLERFSNHFYTFS